MSLSPGALLRAKFESGFRAEGNTGKVLLEILLHALQYLGPLQLVLRLMHGTCSTPLYVERSLFNSSFLPPKHGIILKAQTFPSTSTPEIVLCCSLVRHAVIFERSMCSRICKLGLSEASGPFSETLAYLLEDELPFWDEQRVDQCCRFILPLYGKNLMITCLSGRGCTRARWTSTKVCSVFV